MILFDQIISAVLWFGLVLGIGALDGALAHAERLRVWYKAGGRVSKSDAGIASDTWFGRLKKRFMLPTGWAIAIGVVAYACLAFAAWYPWAFFDPAFHTSIFGILAISFILGTVLLTALFSPLFYWGKSVGWGLLVVVLQFLLAAAALVMVGIATWLPGSIVIGDIATFIVLCGYVAYTIYELIYILFIWIDLDESSGKTKKNKNYDQL
jgi:hypothetical protein